MSTPRLGVVLSAPNTVLERDLWRTGDERASWHSSRVPDRSYDPDDAADHAASVAALAAGVDGAIEVLGPLHPDAVVVGLSAAPFRGGPDDHRRWKDRLETIAGVPIVTLADGIADALAVLDGANVGLLTPLHPDANAPIATYLTGLGVTVGADVGLACAGVTAIAAVTGEQMLAAVDALAAQGVDAIVQVGTNLPFAALADDAARRTGKPVIAGNTALAESAIAAAA